MRAAGRTRIITWNVQGSQGLDVGRCAAHLRSLRADVIAIQEILPGQAGALADALGYRLIWKLKHAPLPRRHEGLSLLSSGPVNASTSFVLRSAPWFSWRRRIAVVAHLAGLVVVNVHLSPGADDGRRAAEVDRLLRHLSLTADDGLVVCGDLNVEPPAASLEALGEAGLVDAWASAPTGAAGRGATNWTPGPRAGRPPTQRLDAVHLPSRWTVAGAWVPTDDLDEWARLSDHLPLVVDVEVPEPNG